MLFYATPNLEFNISTYDIMPYSAIKEEESLKPGYIDGQLKKLQTDPKMAYIYNNNIGNYYQNKGDISKAETYYNASLAALKEDSFKKDPSSFYSFRGLLKFNLKQGGTDDLEKALTINPNDSIAIFFYPMFLINTQQVPRAEQLLIKSLQDKNAGFKQYSYLFLCFTKVYGAMGKFMMLDEEQQAQYSRQELDQILNFDEYDKYVDAKHPDFVRIKQMIEIYSAFFKFMPDIKSDKTAFTPADAAFFSTKEKYFKELLSQKNQNQYAVYRSLGIINVLQKKYDAALSYYDKAIKSFPAKKENKNFNPFESLSNVAFVHYLKKNPALAIQAYRKAMEVRTITLLQTKETSLDIASMYFESDNMAQAETEALVHATDNFEANLMLAYVSFKRQYPLAADTYLAKAQSQTNSENELCRLVTLISVLNLHNGNLDNARILYNENKNLFVETGCTDCEKILDKYLVLNK
ncbi:MAG: tetratricopeptide repeat protein [Flavobacterium sp.]|nr:MAG: tetratricopeptide repeat protein [Flavobacterium sp.]